MKITNKANLALFLVPKSLASITVIPNLDDIDMDKASRRLKIEALFVFLKKSIFILSSVS